MSSRQTVWPWVWILGLFLLVSGLLVGAFWTGYIWNLANYSEAEQRVRAVLAEQVEAWNDGDLERFMDSYDDQVTFFTGGTILEGREALAARYRQRYQKEGKEMGRLSFRELHVQALNGDHVFARGRWKVEMQPETPEGLFTLLLRRTATGWKIVHDHTSSVEPPKTP